MDAILEAIREGNEEAISRLLEDADPALLEKADRRGNRPLKMAAHYGHLGVVKLLVQRGADVNATGFWRRTALHEAADWGHEEVVAFLLEQGAEANGRDDNQSTPLSLACQKGHCGVVVVLLQHMGAQGLEQRDEEGWTALHWAVDGGEGDVVAFLLSQGAQGNIAANDGSTPLICACQHRHLGVVVNRNSRVVQLLLQYVGAQGLEDRDEDGWTALHWAANGGNGLVVRILLLAGADPTTMDNEGKTPLTLAQEGPSEDTCYGSLDEEELSDYAKCVAVFEWWDGELERRYLLQRARALHDASMTQRDQPTSQVPTYLEARVAAGHALPRVEMVLPQSEEQQGEEEERHAMLAYVVKALNQELLTELLEGFHTPKGEAQG